MGRQVPFPIQVMLGILLVCAVQGSRTIGLHCAQLLVNVSRDEAIWRSAYVGMKRNSTGARLSTNPLRAALLSCETIVLIFAKLVLHWVMGQGMGPYALPFPWFRGPSAPSSTTSQDVSPSIEV